MRKLIHSNFELELSSFKISDTEENSIFSDTFFTKYSFPFEIDLSKDLDIAIGFISFYNSTTIQTYFELQYVHGNKIEAAIFEVEQMAEKLFCLLRFGFETLPSFGKKLADLSLDNFTLPAGTTIYQHANSIVNQTWPAVNYNFPMVHTNKYDTTTYPWETFEGIINKRISGQFITNYYDAVEEINYNRNIMQPLPSFLHILQRGMLDGGYILAGGVLNDIRLKNAYLFSDRDYFTNNNLDITYNISFYLNDFDSVDFSHGSAANPRIYTIYDRSVTITTPGFYRLVGSFQSFSGYAVFQNSIKVLLNGTPIFYQHNPSIIYDGSLLNWDIDIPLDLTGSTNLISIHAEQFGDNQDDRQLCDLNVVFISKRDLSGNLLPTIYNENAIDLRKAVPDILFDDFIKIIKNWFNYDITGIQGNQIFMDPISLEVVNPIDLSNVEVKFPIRKFQQGQSFLLKFQDIDNKEFTFLPVFQNRNSVVTSNFKIDDKTSTIEINALPLPLADKASINTAFAFFRDDAKVFLVNYQGLNAGKNTALPNDDYLLPNIHPIYWRNWFNFRINSQSFNWTFKSWIENLGDLNVKSFVYAYGNYHLIKTINKTEIKPDLFEIEIETYSIK
jgi:hypothetical protein